MTITQLAAWLASKPRKRQPSTIVLHATAGSSLGGAISTLKLRGCSYHYLIEKDGKITKCVPVGRVAFHAGVSEGPEGPNVNGYSVGVSLVNLNDGKDPYTEAQYDACLFLVRNLAANLPSLRWITTHYAIAPKRKTDPKGFDVERVAGRLTPWPCEIHAIEGDVCIRCGKRF